MSSMPATREQIVHTFLNIPYHDRVFYNWGTAGSREDAARWNVNDETYINGIILTVDMDFIMGYLIEVVDRESGIVSFFTIVEFFGPRPDGTQEHDSTMFQGKTGTFFEREVEQDVIAMWGVNTIYGLVQAWEDAKKATR